jgi:glycosyltransferase involved in cell wall biosynthesis
MKVSIIIPYNIDRGWLSEAVASCENQEGMTLNKDYEIIVQQGGALGANVNEAVRRAKGEFIKNCAEDDKLAPGCIKALYDFAVKGNYDFVCADAYSFGKGKELELVQSTIPVMVKDLAEQNTIHGGTILYRKSKMPEWNENHWTGEEYDVTLRMAENGCKFGKLENIVYWYRIHIKQKSLVYMSHDGEMIKKRLNYIQDEIKSGYLRSQNLIVR